MNATAILADAEAVFELLQLALRAKQEVGPYLDKLNRLLVKHEALTPEESAALPIERRRLSAILQAPLPPERP